MTKPTAVTLGGILSFSLAHMNINFLHAERLDWGSLSAYKYNHNRYKVAVKVINPSVSLLPDKKVGLIVYKLVWLCDRCSDAGGMTHLSALFCRMASFSSMWRCSSIIRPLVGENSRKDQNTAQN